MPKFYVTYGCGSVNANCYSEVEAEDYDQAREHIFKATEGKFSFMYSEKDFEGQAEKYGLRLVPLAPSPSSDWDY